MKKELSVNVQTIKFLDKYKYSLYALISTWFVAIIIFTLRSRLIGGEYTFAHSDMINQMIPMIKLFLRQLFVNHNVFYSFQLGLGNSSIPNYTLYSCFSPFNFLLLLPLNADIQCFLLVFSKLSFAAFSFCELNRIIFKKKDIITVALSLAYVFCGFNMAYYFVIIWQDGMYMLPIIMILIHKLLNEKKSPGLILAYALLFIFNFYSGYVIGIFSFLVFILYIFLIDTTAKRNEKAQIILRYFLYVISAFMLSSIVILPTIVAVYKASTSEATVFNASIISVFDLIKQFYLGQISDEVGFYPYGYSSLLALLLCPYFFFCNNIEKKYKIYSGLILLLLFFVSLTIPGYMLVHAFNAPDNFGHRYAYLYSFVMLLMLAYLRNYWEKVNKKILLTIAIIEVIFIAFYSIIQNQINVDYKTNNNLYVIIINIMLILGYSFVLIYGKRKKQLINVLFVIIIFDLIINGIIFDKYLSRNPNEKKEYFEYFYGEEERNIRSLDKEEDLFRLYAPNTLLYNSPQMMNYRGIGIFSSIQNQKMITTLRKLGYKTNFLNISDVGSTKVTRMLFGQNYQVNNKSYKDYFAETSKSTVYERINALPVAFMVSDNVSDFSFEESDNPFVEQNKLLSTMCGEDIECFYNTGSNIQLVSDNISISDAKVEDVDVIGFALEDESVKYGNIKFIDDTCESEYAYFDMIDSYAYLDSPYIGTDLKYYFLGFEENKLSEPHIVEMSQEMDNSLIYIIIDENTASTYYFKKAYFYGTKYDEYDKAYNVLHQNEMNVEILKDGYIKGSVESINQKGTLFTSIPYEEGWNIYIDGKKGTITPLIDDSFVGAIIPEGKHIIELKYIDKWAIKGGIISLGGLILSVLMLSKEEYIKRINDR